MSDAIKAVAVFLGAVAATMALILAISHFMK
jgi:hypothetical protein